MDFSKLCRACNAEKTNLLNLFANDCDDEPTLGEKFLICTALELLEADEYPQSICYSCAKQLETAYKFRRQCERSFHQLEQKLTTYKEQLLAKQTAKVETDVKKQSKLEPILIEHDDQEMRPVESFTNMVNDEAESISFFTTVKAEAETTQSENCESADYIDLSRLESSDENEESKETTDFSVTVMNRHFQCTHCDKNFFTSKALDLHLKLQHKIYSSSSSNVKQDGSPEKSAEPHGFHICIVCDKPIGNIDDLRMHRILEHSQPASKCTVCNLQIRGRMSYKKHLLTHYANKPYDCKVCGKLYTEYRYLYRHMFYHRTASFKCVETNCGKSFTMKHKFVEHLRLFHNQKLSSENVRNIQPVED